MEILDVKFRVCALRYVTDKAKGYVNIVENTDGQVISDTCAVVTWVREPGVETIMTNSAKNTYYLLELKKVKVIFAPLTQCINRTCR